MTADAYSLDVINALVASLKSEQRVFIQPHDFPDHDAVASAFGLQHFLRHHGIASHLVYDMEIQRGSLKTVIRDLAIDIQKVSACAMSPQDKIILVDGCKGNKNVSDLIGDEVAVIDHHQAICPDDIEFADIRTEYGACASIVASYFFEANVPLPQAVATALMIGISLDTGFLTRGTCAHDLKAYWQCFPLADTAYVNSVLRNNIQYDDLQYYRFMLKHMVCTDRLAFCFFPGGCDQNLLGILGDFLLSLDTVDFVVLCARNDNRINLSLRSETAAWAADRIVRRILAGIGFGGGHAEMAGGVVNDATLFDPEILLERTVTALRDTRTASVACRP